MVAIRNPQINAGNIGLGQFGDLTPVTIFGNNDDVDTGGDVDIVNFDQAVAYPDTAETITSVSTSTQDSSLLIVSGTISENTTTRQILSDTDLSSVLKGDVFINLTNNSYGFVLEVLDNIPLVCGGDIGFKKTKGDSFQFYRNNFSTGGILLLLSGLDADFKEQKEFIPLNGLTFVVSTKTFSRLNVSQVIGAGSEDGNVGIITSYYTDIGLPTGIIARVLIGLCRSSNAIFTVPDGKIAYATEYTIGLFRTITGGLGGSFKIFSRSCAPSGGSPWTLFQRIPQQIQGANPFTQVFNPVLPIQELTDIRFSVSVTDNNSEVFALMQFYLQDLTP